MNKMKEIKLSRWLRLIYKAINLVFTLRLMEVKSVPFCCCCCWRFSKKCFHKTKQKREKRGGRQSKALCQALTRRIRLPLFPIFVLVSECLGFFVFHFSHKIFQCGSSTSLLSFSCFPQHVFDPMECQYMPHKDVKDQSPCGQGKSKYPNGLRLWRIKEG